MLKAWNVKLSCGREIHGSDIGSFANIKHRDDIVDLYVNTGAGKVHAPIRNGIKPLAFDFFVHVSIESNGSQKKHWKLVSIYPDCKIINHVFPDGRSRMERQ